MFRRNPDVVAIVVVLLWTLSGQVARPAFSHAPMAGIRLILAPVHALRCLTLPALNLRFHR